MTSDRIFNHYLIGAVILFLGLGFALALPWLASSQSQAAQSEVSTQDSVMNLHVHRKGFSASPAKNARFVPDSERAPEAITRYYVAKTGDGTDPTVEWSTAYTNVQDALAVAAEPSEIWVAEGVYYPDVGSGQIDNAVTSTFVMTDGVALYGGFDTDDTLFSDRDWETKVTVLSGDIDGNDIKDSNGVVITTTNIISDNTYHVITAIWVTKTAVLDGFTITAGQAKGENEIDECGGGFYCDGSGSGNACIPSLINLAFSGNFAYDGGAIYNDGLQGISSPNLREVSFSSNSADNDGGAMYNYGSYGNSNPSLINVTFSDNSADDDGGAIYNYSYNHNGTSSPSLINVTLSGNSAGDHGGAMYNQGTIGTSSPSLTNVTFSGNSAGSSGGAIYSWGKHNGTSKPEVRNSILWNNQDSSGTGTITATIYNNSATITLTHSLAQGTGDSSNWTLDPGFVNGGGNIDADPMFVTPIDPSTAPTTTGNLHLQGGSPAIDVGDDTYVVDVPTDLDGNARIKDGDGNGSATVDMGAYEADTHFQLSVTKAGTGGGQVTSSPAGIDCGDICSKFFLEDSSITLMPTPNIDSIFTGWSGACSDIGDCEVTMDGAKSVTATFEADLSSYLPLINR